MPPEDEERFLRDLYPSLRRRIVVVSSDQSVDLPELPAARLVLTVRHVEGHRIELRWSRSAAGATWREDLWEAPSRLGDRMAEDRIVEAVTASSSSSPSCSSRRTSASDWPAEAMLSGMAAVRFLAEMLPVLEAIDGVDDRGPGRGPRVPGDRRGTAWSSSVGPPRVTTTGSISLSPSLSTARTSPSPISSWRSPRVSPISSCRRGRTSPSTATNSDSSPL